MTTRRQRAPHGEKIGVTPTFSAHDGTELAFRLHGEGAPVICFPCGPMQDSVDLGDLDGLETLREHLGLERLDLLAHSSGANLATLYVARYPDRVSKPVLVTPSSIAVGISVEGSSRIAIARLRDTEGSWRAIDPFYYGRWDATARAHQEDHDKHRNNEAAAVFGADGAFDPDATRAALVIQPTFLRLIAPYADGMRIVLRFISPRPDAGRQGLVARA